MKIAIIQASSQADKNRLLYDAVKSSDVNDEIIDFGCFEDEAVSYSYIEISILIGILLSSKTVDFVVTGCSSGQGMMLACNSMPGVLCGYIPSPKDAYLFAQINNGNAVSLPLGEDYTYAGEENLKETIRALFLEPFGQGYPKSEAERKKKDTCQLKQIRKNSQTDMISLLQSLHEDLLRKVLSRKNVIDHVLQNTDNIDLIRLISDRKGNLNDLQEKDSKKDI